MSLITLSDLKTFLGVSGTSEDAKLEIIRQGVEAAVERFCQRRFAQQQYTELYDGTGTERLYLDHRPVVSVAEVRVASGLYGGVGHDDAFPDSGVWTQNEDFILPRTDESEQNMGLLVAVNAVWPLGVANVKVTATCGYSTIPQDVQLACYLMAATVRQAAEKGTPVASERIGDYSYQLLATGTTDELVRARRLLTPYREVRI